MKLYAIDRSVQIKHFKDLEQLKGKEVGAALQAEMARSEKYVLQLAVVAETEQVIEAVQCTGTLCAYCLNTHIVDKHGNASARKVPLQPASIQPLFFIITAQDQAEDTGTVQIEIKTDCGTAKLPVTFRLTDEAVQNHGYNDLWRLARLDWLNSSRYLDDTVPLPYTPVAVNQRGLSILGRDILIGDNGLPEQIEGFFDEGICLKNVPQTSYFSQPMSFEPQGMHLSEWTLKLEEEKNGAAVIACAQGAGYTLKTVGKWHYEGFADYQIFITAEEELAFDGLAHKAVLRAGCDTYMNGLGAVGGKTAPLNFCWNPDKHLDALFMGGVNAGIRLKWKAEQYQKPLINIYYKNLPLHVPQTTWDNHGNGSITVTKIAGGTSIEAKTGKFHMQKGETRCFCFELHITPLKPIDYQKHFAVRYSHNNHLKNEQKEVAKAKKLGLTDVVVHHGNMVHPFINYPFIETQRLKNMVQDAAGNGLGVKVYYTTREHSNHMAEVFAYKALGDEIILRQKGKGFPWHGGTAKWLTDYFGETIIPAWKVDYRSGKYKNDPDVSFLVRPNSRLDNYYIEGLDWLVKKIGIKGIYIDDTALDRTTIERARKVLMQNDGLIDMHMWNHEEERAGDVSCMNLYTELFPFLDSLWIGEGYPYKKLSPDYLLTEVAGIPYGLTSQMLEGGGDPYIGMLYGMNNRYGWGVYNACRIYRLWDTFRIEQSQMLGYWHSQNPVSTGMEAVLATVYRKRGEALICLYNFSDKAQSIQLDINESKMGFPCREIRRAEIKGLQRDKKLSPDHSIKLKAKSGLILNVK